MGQKKISRERAFLLLSKIIFNRAQFTQNEPYWAVSYLIRGKNLTPMSICNHFYLLCIEWQYGLSSFQAGGLKLERFLPNNQHTQRKFLNFENWTNGEVSKSAEI